LNLTSCDAFEANRRFDLQHREISQARNRHEADSKRNMLRSVLEDNSWDSYVFLFYAPDYIMTFGRLVTGL
jgi:hypothetical protein